MRTVNDRPTAYLAVDPGLVTGVAMYLPDVADFPSRFMSSEIEGGAAGFADAFRRMCGTWDFKFVTSEMYDIESGTFKKTRQYDALYVNGWLTLECPHLGIGFSLSPRANKVFGSDAKLRHLGWFSRTPGGHRNDAARHMVALLAKRDRDVLRKLGEML